MTWTAVPRRLITIPVYVLAWVALTVVAPVWLPLGLLICVLRRRSFVVLRLLCFGWCYFGLELIALVLILGVFATRPDVRSREASLLRLQSWWAFVNLRIAAWFLRLHFVVENADQAYPGPAIVLMRHASILDTLLPSVFIQRPHQYRLRYVLKKELLLDPCIDIVGNALPNYFVDRGGDTQREIGGVQRLATDLGEEGVLMFPEGTRFSPEKRQRAINRLVEEGSALVPMASELVHVLPPRPGGVLALMRDLPEADCVFVAHSGLEDFAKVKDLLSGRVVGATVCMKVWRVRASDIPELSDEKLRWLYEEWKDVDTFVGNAMETSWAMRG